MCDCKIALQISQSIAIFNNKIEGPARFLMRQMLSFITRKCNVTYVPLPFYYPTGSVCSDDGVCEGLAGDFQKGYFDFVPKQFTTVSLQNIGTNLTTAVENLQACAAIYPQNAIIRHSSSTPFDSLSEFGLEVIFIFTCLMALLTLLFMVIIIKHTQSSLKQIIWNNFEYFSCQNSLSTDFSTQKWVYGFYIIVLFLARILLTSNLQTGLIIDKHYIKLTSYRDIIEYNYQPVCLENSHCHTLLVESTDHYAKLVTKKLQFLEGQSSNWLDTYNQMHRVDHVTLEKPNTYELLKKIGCSFAVEQEKKMPLIRRPISYSYTSYLINKNSPPKVKDVILKGLYAEKEYETTLKRRTHKQLTSQLKINPSPSCYNAEDASSEDSETVPLRFHYMIDPLILYAVGIAIASIVFAFRLKTPCYPSCPLNIVNLPRNSNNKFPLE
uniref:Uncharacterized protein n=1 Tax=Tetranychus urticae TaxID=32264 RepID=T1KGX3_TETUR